MPTAKLQPTPASNADAVLDCLLARRSVRRFTGADITPDEERQLIDAAFAAPSGNNTRPWHFVFVRDPETRAALKAHARVDLDARQGAARRRRAGARADASPWWIEDGAAAIENMLTDGDGTRHRQRLVRHARRGDRGRRAARRAAARVLGVARRLPRARARSASAGRPSTRSRARRSRRPKLSFERFGRRSR